MGEGHASAALTMRHRPGLTEKGLGPHADLHQMRALFAASKLERCVHRINAALRRLAEKQPDRVTGRHMYLKFVV